MIIVKLNGGLGNQLFQYALGRHLAELHQTKLVLDNSFFQSNKERTYELSNFNIKELFVPRSELRKVPVITNKAKQRLLNGFRKVFSPYRLIVEKQFNYDPQILISPDNSCLEGCWQTEKYFKAITPIIYQEFTIKNKLKDFTIELANQISQTLSISLHIRRGDYVTNSVTNQYHGVCSLEYYRQAVNLITEKHCNPHFYIFSDDPDWVAENIRLEYPTVYVTHNGIERAYEDLYLMSLCKHNIVANSSFSWWGAWLNQNIDKMVIAPQKWFNDTSIDTSDLTPREWIRL